MSNQTLRTWFRAYRLFSLPKIDGSSVPGKRNQVKRSQKMKIKLVKETVRSLLHREERNRMETASSGTIAFLWTDLNMKVRHSRTKAKTRTVYAKKWIVNPRWTSLWQRSPKCSAAGLNAGGMVLPLLKSQGKNTAMQALSGRASNR